jgi:carboxypeptidase Taq
MSALATLESRFRQLSALEGSASMLHWDSATMLPEDSGAVRGEQLAALADIAHEKLSSADMPDLFAQAQQEATAPATQASLREMHRRWQHATALPAPLVGALTKARHGCEQIWREAKRTNDYALFLPSFREVLRLTREAAAAKASALTLSPYDALLDSFDPDMRTAIIDPLFADLKRWLPTLVAQAEEAQKHHAPAAPLAAPVAAQEALGRHLMLALGFNTAQGRIDTSAHPFCGGVPGDVRITTRYREENAADALFGVLHETGHALYEQNLPAAWRGLPVGEARGMSAHESQSLFIEMQICRSEAFLQYLRPLLASQLGIAVSAEPLRQQVQRVERSFIRVNADEVTYPLHIILRYELEQALLSGDLLAEDLPTAWNEKMQHYLGITPPDVAQGCLQDIHWPEGMLGYFPTYTLGAMIAAQLMATMKRTLDVDRLVTQGEFAPIIAWLATHWHQKASSLSLQEMLQEATGEGLNATLYRAHLHQRYGG